MILRLVNIVETSIDPALGLLPKAMTSDAARLMLLAIGLQESRFEARYQVLTGGGKGAARGFWQFERGTKTSKGGVWGVYLHKTTRNLLGKLCLDRDCAFDPAAIWERLEHDDILAAGVARLLLWTNANPLPAVGDQQGAWNYYANTWRPGNPHPQTWPALYAQAADFIAKEHML